jgi:hypothetical protein
VESVRSRLYGWLIISIISGNIDGFFSSDLYRTNHGFRNPTHLFELQNLYELHIEIKDDHSTSKSIIKKITIEVVDVNRPHFSDQIGFLVLETSN